jgi:hypothetical protein
MDASIAADLNPERIDSPVSGLRGNDMISVKMFRLDKYRINKL